MTHVVYDKGPQFDHLAMTAPQTINIQILFKWPSFLELL